MTKEYQHVTIPSDLLWYNLFLFYSSVRIAFDLVLGQGVGRIILYQYANNQLHFKYFVNGINWVDVITGMETEPWIVFEFDSTHNIFFFNENRELTIYYLAKMEKIKYATKIFQLLNLLQVCHQITFNI